MPVALTDEQIQLTDAMAGFAARYASMEQTRTHAVELGSGARPPCWPELVNQGWQAVHLPVDVGGQGGDLAAAACLLDAAGYALLPGALLPTVIAGAVVAAADDGPARTAVLTGIASGATAVALLPEAGVLSAAQVAGGWSVTGSAGPEIGLPGAQRVIVSARTAADELLWMVLDPGAPGVQIDAEPPTDSTRSVGSVRVPTP